MSADQSAISLPGLAPAWTPPQSLEERAKQLLVPPAVYIRYLFAKNLRHGEAELKLIPWLARRDRVSLDIGANKGVYSFALLKHSAEVHAFEPQPKLFAVLERWARGRVHLHQVALSNVSGQAQLLVPRTRRGWSNQGASLSAVKVCGEHQTLSVPAVRLDDLGLTNVGFIKIDVEGFEQEVLEGAARLLARDRPTLLVELEEKHTRVPLETMVANICAHGYRCYALVRGALTPFGRIDLARHHRSPKARADYVFNFIFLPD